MFLIHLRFAITEAVILLSLSLSIYIYIYIYIYICVCVCVCGTFNRFPDIFVRAFKIVIDS